jgi:uncharacterized protein YukE
VIDAKPTANPDELEAAARTIRAEAANLERALDPYQRASAGAQWRGQAATQFQSDVGAEQRASQSLAGQLRQLAGQLENGAGEIRRYLADLRARRARAAEAAKNALAGKK